MQHAASLRYLSRDFQANATVGARNDIVPVGAVDFEIIWVKSFFGQVVAAFGVLPVAFVIPHGSTIPRGGRHAD